MGCRVAMRSVGVVVDYMYFIQLINEKTVRMYYLNAKPASKIERMSVFTQMRRFYMYILHVVEENRTFHSKLNAEITCRKASMNS